MSTNRLRTRLAAFDASIAEHQVALEMLQRGRATVAAELSSKATFSVVTLPVEITTAIFTLCLPSIEELHEHNIRRRDGSAMPPTLGHTDLPTAAHCMRSAIRRYADRLEELDFKTTASSLDIEFMDLDRIHFPLLRRAVLANNDPDRGLWMACKVFGNAPRLCEVGVYPIAWPSSFTFPWPQLTKYEGPISNVGLFSLATNLIEMRCDAVGGIYDKTKTVVLVHLRSLTLSGPSVRITCVLLQLTLPALVSLRISGSVYPGALASCLERSAPLLQTLSLALSHAEGEDGSGRWKPSLASVAATLENLELHSPSHEFLSDVLHLPAHEDFSLPCLKTLSVFNSPAVNYKELIAFLHRRTTSTKLARLQSLRLVYRPGVLLGEDVEFNLRHFDAGRRRWRLNATDHMRRLASGAMDIHIGSEKTTLVSLDNRATFDAQPEEYDSADESAGEESYEE
ncbi:hypothetical protein B0H16DRAFT_1722039 [Mycena metata]|uniref:Uncharacterized protein n=1 Tax=Mycena metata TaxID=1033252 RepID=A0AAD7J593_9AGAR|nr:hypothetical protein B0H16DRAFT_1722039 [Mycena metata]